MRRNFVYIYFFIFTFFFAKNWIESQIFVLVIIAIIIIVVIIGNYCSFKLRMMMMMMRRMRKKKKRAYISIEANRSNILLRGWATRRLEFVVCGSSSIYINLHTRSVHSSIFVFAEISETQTRAHKISSLDGFPSLSLSHSIPLVIL